MAGRLSQNRFRFFLLYSPRCSTHERQLLSLARTGVGPPPHPTVLELAPLSGPRTSAPFSRLHVLGTHPSLSLRSAHEPADSLLSPGFFRLELGIRIYRISRVARERITHHFHFHSFSKPIRFHPMLRLCFLLPLLATTFSSCTCPLYPSDPADE